MTNVTIKIDAELARAAKIYAAQRGTSISRLVAEQIAQLVQNNARYEQARARALQSMEDAQPLNWRKPRSRDELHER